MAKTKTKNTEPDAVYFLKLTVYLILGAFWVKVTVGNRGQLPIPLGFLGGMALITRDKVQIDRKIGFAVLLIAALIGFWLPIGLYIRL